MILGHDGPAGTLPVPPSGRRLRRGHPADAGGLGREDDRARRALHGRGRAPHVLRRRGDDQLGRRRPTRCRAGRPRSPSVRVWSVLATIGDHIDEAKRLKKTVGRMASYLQGYGDLLVKVNGWDPAVLERFRADEFVQNFRGGFDAKATTSELEHLATLIPDEWTGRRRHRHAGAVRGGGCSDQFELRRRQRDPPRRHAGRVRARSCRRTAAVRPAIGPTMPANPGRHAVNRVAERRRGPHAGMVVRGPRCRGPVGHRGGDRRRPDRRELPHRSRRRWGTVEPGGEARRRRRSVPPAGCQRLPERGGFLHAAGRDARRPHAAMLVRRDRPTTHCTSRSCSRTWRRGSPACRPTGARWRGPTPRCAISPASMHRDGTTSRCSIWISSRARPRTAPTFSARS